MFTAAFASARLFCSFLPFTVSQMLFVYQFRKLPASVGAVAGATESVRVATGGAVASVGRRTPSSVTGHLGDAAKASSTRTIRSLIAARWANMLSKLDASCESPPVAVRLSCSWFMVRQRYDSWKPHSRQVAAVIEHPRSAFVAARARPISYSAAYVAFTTPTATFSRAQHVPEQFIAQRHGLPKLRCRKTLRRSLAVGVETGKSGALYPASTFATL